MERDDLGRIPPEGVHLDAERLAVVVAAVRALLDGTDPHEANRAHALTIAVVLADAADRRSGDR